MGLLIMNDGRDVSAQVQVHEPDAADQAPTVHEQFQEFLHSEVGGLGQLFGHDPMEHYPAPLETSAEPQLEAGQLDAMQSGMEMAATSTPQSDPGNPPVVAAKWSWGDTVKKEISRVREGLINLGGARGGDL